MPVTETTLTVPLAPTVFWPLAFLALFALASLLVFVALPDLNRRAPRTVDWLAKTGIPPLPAALVAAIFGILFLLALWSSFATLWTQITTPAPESGAPLGTSALIAALLGAPFLLWRSLVAQRTVNIAQESHITDLIAKAVEQLGAEKTVKRIVKTDTETKSEEETVPNLEVRIGAILALERLARQNLDVHVQIMEILTAYIRENAKAKDAPKLPEPPEYTPDDHDGWTKALKEWRNTHDKALTDIRPREDVQKALSVIGRRSPAQRLAEARWQNPDPNAHFVFDDPPPPYPDMPADNHDPKKHAIWAENHSDWRYTLKGSSSYRIDLRRTNLCGADLAGLHLAGAKFDWAQMQGASLYGVQMQGASFDWAKMQGARLFGAQMQGATLDWAEMQGAWINAAEMQGASLNGALMQGARLGKAQMQEASLEESQVQGARLVGTQMQGAQLNQAHMQGAMLDGAQVQGASLDGITVNEKTSFDQASLGNARLSEIDFRDAPNLAASLSDAFTTLFADASVLLPPDHPRPDHWPAWKLDPNTFSTEYAKWRASPSTYTPPPPPP